MNNQDKTTILFFNLVFSLQMTAMQQMGKIKNPITDKIEKNINEAETTIDILDVLYIKTKGNLSEEEETYFSNVLKELKLNFIDEKNKD